MGLYICHTKWGCSIYHTKWDFIKLIPNESSISVIKNGTSCMSYKMGLRVCLTKWDFISVMPNETLYIIYQMGIHIHHTKWVLISVIPNGTLCLLPIGFSYLSCQMGLHIWHTKWDLSNHTFMSYQIGLICKTKSDFTSVTPNGTLYLRGIWNTANLLPTVAWWYFRWRHINSSNESYWSMLRMQPYTHNHCWIYTCME